MISPIRCHQVVQVPDKGLPDRDMPHLIGVLDVAETVHGVTRRW